MAKVTLSDVSTKAMAEPEFWRKLRANTKRTLDEYGLKLTPDDSRRLKGILDLDGKNITVDLDRFMGDVHQRPGGTVLLPGGGFSWMGMWSRLGTVAATKSLPGSRKRR